MHLHLKLKTVNYGDVAVKAMPMLAERQGQFPGSAGMILDAFSVLPAGLVREVFDAVPVEQKNRIVAAFAEEKKKKILGLLNGISRGLGMTLSDYTMGEDLSLAAEIGNIDYLALAEKFLPTIQEKLAAMDRIPSVLRAVIRFATAEKLVGMLDHFVSDKDAFFASLINQSDGKIISMIEKLARD